MLGKLTVCVQSRDGWRRVINRIRVAVGAVVATVTSALAAGAFAADFGAPPSGDVPIIFNDRNVYAKPDRISHARVLAALVKDGEIFVPLRRLFEALGATVTVSPDGRTVTAAKPGSTVACGWATITSS